MPCKMFTCHFVPTGYTLSRRRKLCFLGWSWGISVTFEHGYGKRTESHGKIMISFVPFFLSWFLDWYYVFEEYIVNSITYLQLGKCLISLIKIKASYICILLLLKQVILFWWNLYYLREGSCWNIKYYALLNNESSLIPVYLFQYWFYVLIFLQARFFEAAVAYKKKIGFNGISNPRIIFLVM